MVDNNGLPQPGLDRDEWGTPLNNFLLAQKDQVDTNTAGISQALAGLDLKADAAATTAALAGKAALAGATFTGDVNAPVVDGGSQVINVKHPNFGAVGDGSTDDTLAVQSALDTGRDVFFPAGTFLVSGLSITNSGQRLRGLSPDSSTISSLTGDVLTISSTANVLRVEVVDLTILARTGAGHCVNVPYGVNQSRFNRVYFNQQNAGKSILYCHRSAVGGGLFDNHWVDCLFQPASASTVPGFDVVGVGNPCSANLWQRCRVQGGASPAFHIEAGPSSYVYNNTFEKINFEVCNGGGIHIFSGLDTAINEVGFFDNTTITQDMVRIGATAGCPQSRGTAIRSVTRTAGTLSAGAVDVHLVAGQNTGTTILESISAPTTAGMTVDLGAGAGRAVLIGIDTTVTVSNSVAANTVMMSASSGLVAPTVRTGSGATGSRPSAATVGAGTAWFDTTLGQPIWSTGSAWVKSDGTAA